jgi:hypothetical protein
MLGISCFTALAHTYCISFTGSWKLIGGFATNPYGTIYGKNNDDLKYKIPTNNNSHKVNVKICETTFSEELTTGAMVRPTCTT